MPLFHRIAIKISTRMQFRVHRDCTSVEMSQICQLWMPSICINSNCSSNNNKLNNLFSSSSRKPLNNLAVHNRASQTSLSVIQWTFPIHPTLQTPHSAILVELLAQETSLQIWDICAICIRYSSHQSQTLPQPMCSQFGWTRLGEIMHSHPKLIASTFRCLNSRLLTCCRSL